MKLYFIDLLLTSCSNTLHFTLQQQQWLTKLCAGGDFRWRPLHSIYFFYSLLNPKWAQGIVFDRKSVRHWLLASCSVFAFRTTSGDLQLSFAFSSRPLSITLDEHILPGESSGQWSVTKSSIMRRWMFPQGGRLADWFFALTVTW